MKLTVEQVFDDLTGEGVIVSEEAALTLEVRGKEYAFTLDFERASTDALLAAFQDHDYSPLRKLFTAEPVKAEPAKTPKPKPKRKRDSESAAIREWAKSQGISVPERGRLPNEVVGRYHDALDITALWPSGTLTAT